MEKIHWREWFALLLVIMLIIVAIDWYFGTHYIGATARMLWNSVAFIAQSLARTIEVSLALLFRRRATRIVTGLFTAVGLVYVSHLILTDGQVKQAHTWREKIRAGTRTLTSHLRTQWFQLPLIGKCAIVALAIGIFRADDRRMDRALPYSLLGAGIEINQTYYCFVVCRFIFRKVVLADVWKNTSHNYRHHASDPRYT
jgi:hypothetical protein